MKMFIRHNNGSVRNSVDSIKNDGKYSMLLTWRLHDWVFSKNIGYKAIESANHNQIKKNEQSVCRLCNYKLSDRHFSIEGEIIEMECRIGLK